MLKLLTARIAALLLTTLERVAIKNKIKRFHKKNRKKFVVKRKKIVSDFAIFIKTEKNVDDYGYLSEKNDCASIKF